MVRNFNEAFHQKFLVLKTKLNYKILNLEVNMIWDKNGKI